MSRDRMPPGVDTRKRRLTREADARKQRYLGHLREGHKPVVAAEKTGVKLSTVQGWRARDVDFRKALDLIKATRRANSKDFDGSFVNFRKLYLGMDTTWFQLKAAEVIEQAPPGSVTLILWPPGHGKTTLLEDWCTYKLVTEPSFRITVGSAQIGHSQKVLERVRNRLTSEGPTPTIHRDFGPFEPQEGRGTDHVWAAKKFNTYQKRASDERDYCVDPETEILTRRGWLTVDQLHEGDLAWGLDHDSGLAHWTPVTAVNRWPAKSRRMLSSERKGHSSLTTAGHRWPVIRNGKRLWLTSEELVGYEGVPLTAQAAAYPEQKWSDDLVELVAWFWTEGWFDRSCARLSQSETANPHNVLRIRALLRRLVGEVHEYLKPNGTIVWTLRKTWRERLATICPEKVPDPGWLSELTLAQLREFIEVSIEADGSTQPGQVHFTQADERRIRAFEMACALAGVATSTTHQTSNGRPHWHATVRTAVTAALKGRWVEVDGEIWCPTTETGTWLARRRGTVYFTGNSMSAVGLTANVQGTRADLMLLDDVQSLTNYEQTDKFFNIIVQDFLSRPNMFGRTVIIGTRVGEFDVYRKLMDAEIVHPDRIVKFPAYNVARSSAWTRPAKAPDPNDPTTMPPTDVEWLWPEVYKPHAYAELRWRIGEQAWARNYMQHPEAATAMTFPESITTLMHDTVRGWTADPEPLPGGSRVPVVLSLDPAIGGGNGTLAGAMRPNKLEVLESRLDYDLTSYGQIFDILDDMAWRYTTPTSYVSEVVIEDKAFQRGLLQDDRLIEMQRRFGFRVVPNNTGREKVDPDIGIPAMPQSMIRGEITIPAATAESLEKMASLLAHLHTWRPGVNGVKLAQDMAICLWQAWRRWRAQRDLPLHRAPTGEQFHARPSPLRTRGFRPMVHR